MFILYTYMCIYIGGRFFFLYNKKKKIHFVFTAKGFFFPFPFQESSQAIVFLRPRDLGLLNGKPDVARG